MAARGSLAQEVAASCAGEANGCVADPRGFSEASVRQGDATCGRASADGGGLGVELGIHDLPDIACEYNLISNIS